MKENNVLMKIVTVILSVLFILTALAAFGTGIVKYTILNRDFYENIAFSDEFASKAKEAIDEKLELDCKVYTFPYEKISGAVSKNEISSCVSKQIDALFSDDPTSVFELGDLFESRIIYDAAEKYLKDISDKGIFSDDKNVELLSEKVSERINLIIKSPFSQTLLKKAVTRVYASEKLDRIASFFPVFIIAAAAIFALLLLMKMKNIIGGMYLTASLLFSSGALMFIPTAFIRGRGIAERVALSDDYLKNIFNSIFSGAMDKAFYVTLLVFFVSVVYLVVSAVLKARKHAGEINNE